MNKRIISTVSCASQDASDVPETFTVLIDDALAGRIRELASVVQSLKTNAIEDYQDSGLWSNASLDDLDIEEDDQICSQTVAALTADRARIEHPAVRVAATRFYFKAVPKHCDADLALITRGIDLSALDSDETLIIE